MRTQTKLLLVVAVLATLAGCKSRAPENMAAKMPAASPEAMAPAATAPTPMLAGPAKYRVEFTPLWTKSAFPFEYPDTSLLHRPHFSGLIGTAHNASYAIFTEGQVPSRGLERLSETGSHDPLDAEIRAAIAAGNALALTESDALKDFTHTAAAEVAVDDAHALVSLVAMIAPSPDWFAGVGGVNLMENGAWVASKTVDAQAWDSGGDGGSSYLSNDQDADPKQPTTRNQSPHFMKDGGTPPVGRFTFTRI